MKCPVLFLMIAAALPAQTVIFSDEIQNYTLQANSFVEALKKLSAGFQFPLGIEWTKSTDTLTPIDLHWDRITLSDAIQTLVSIPAGYGWRTEEGVVHVFQTRLVTDQRT